MNLFAVTSSSSLPPGSDGAGAPPPDAPPSPLLPLPRVAGDLGSCADDVGATLAALAVENGQAQRRVATASRDADEARAEEQAVQEVAALHAEAGSIREQAWFDAVTSGAQVAAQQSAPGGSQTSSSGSVASGALGGAKAFGDGLFAADEKDDEASAKGYDAGVTSARFASDGAHDALADAQSLVQSALELYREFVATQAQTRSAALRGA